MLQYSRINQRPTTAKWGATGGCIATVKWIAIAIWIAVVTESEGIAPTGIEATGVTTMKIGPGVA
jgi:hypothetical protein